MLLFTSWVATAATMQLSDRKNTAIWITFCHLCSCYYTASKHSLVWYRWNVHSTFIITTPSKLLLQSTRNVCRSNIHMKCFSITVLIAHSVHSRGEVLDVVCSEVHSGTYISGWQCSRYVGWRGVPVWKETFLYMHKPMYIYSQTVYRRGFDVETFYRKCPNLKKIFLTCGRYCWVVQASYPSVVLLTTLIVSLYSSLNQRQRTLDSVIMFSPEWEDTLLIRTYSMVPYQQFPLIKPLVLSSFQWKSAVGDSCW